MSKQYPTDVLGTVFQFIPHTKTTVNTSFVNRNILI